MKDKKPQSKRSLAKRIFRFVLKSTLLLLLLFVLLVLFIRSPWGQNLIVDKVTNYVSKEIGTPFQIDKFYLTFDGNLAIDGVYLEDQAQDTLFYSQELEIDIPILPILQKNQIRIQNLNWTGLVANINRTAAAENFNYQFIMDAFASPDETPKEENAAYTFEIENTKLKDFQLSYVDNSGGLKSSIALGELDITFQKFDLNSLDFQLKNWYLKDTKFVYHQEKSVNVTTETKPETDASPTENLPLFKLNELIFENVQVQFEDENAGLKLNSKLKNFQLDEAFVNLNKDEFKVEKFHLAESFVELNIPKSTSPNQSDVQNEPSFIWPAYFVKLTEVELMDNRFQFTRGEQEINAYKFDKDAFEVTNLQLSLKDFQLEKEEKATFNLNNLSFKESSGFQLQQLAFNLMLNSTQLEVNSFVFETSKNKLDGNVNLQYNQLRRWIEEPSSFQHTSFNLNGNLDLVEFISIYPDLKKIAYIQDISKHPLVLNVKSNGNLNRLLLQQFNLKWASTQLKARGVFTQLMHVEQLTYQLENYTISTQKKDILSFIELDQTSFNLPEKINLSGYASGDLNSLKTESILKIPEGELSLFADLQQQQEIRLNTRLEFTKMDLGKIFNQPELKPVSLILTAKAEGKDWLELKGELNSNFSELNYADLDLSDLTFSGQISNKNVSLQSSFDQEDLQFTTFAEIELDSLQPKADLVFNLKGVDFRKLGLSPKDIRARSRLTAHFSGNENQFDFNSTIDSTLVIYENETYVVKNIELNAKVNEHHTQFTTNSGFLTTKLEANAHPNELMEALQEHYQYYVTNQNAFRETEHPVEIKWKMRFNETPFISEVLRSGIEESDTLSVDFEFNEYEHQLNADVSLPKLIYNENELDSLAFHVQTNLDKANFSLGFKNLKAGVLEIAKTQLYGDFEDEQLRLNFESYKAGEAFFNMNTLFAFREDEIEFKILPERLILDQKPWNISLDNYIKLLRGENEVKLLFNEFELTRNKQYVGFRNDFDIDKVHAGIAFKDFKLSTLTRYLNSEEDFVKGIVSGDLIMVNPFEKIGIISDLRIENLEVLQNPIGRLSLNATSDSDESYQLKLDLTGEQIQFNADGNINNTSGIPYCDLEANLEQLDMQLMEKFAKNYITNTKGNIAATFKLDGTIEALDYRGSLSFLETELRVNTLNALFKLGDEKIEFNKDKISLNNFTLRDVKENAFTINGEIGIEEFLNPKFDLSAKATNFEALNSTKEDNDLYFGTVNFDADVQLLGDLNFPIIEGELTFRDATDITYIVPLTQAAAVEREGLVVFVNKKNPGDILTRNEEEQFNMVFSGIEMNTLLKINPKVKAKVVFNKSTGDNVVLVGGGDLKFNMARNGNTTLFGKYEVSKGQFELNFYNLVTRNFKIAKGSSVNWTGDPLNADIDIRAIYAIETSASSLMASQISGESPSVQNQYRQQLPFEVYLDVHGEINAPELDFELDMPEESRAAINGSVYSRVMQINQQADELNKQVFSLLVLNRFYPSVGSDGSQGGATSIARDNINQALSDQLNNYAKKLTGNTGIQLNFDINSYTDFQSGEANNRTDLAITAQKKLFDDRLVIESGSQVNVEGDLRPGESNVALGNVSVQYLITEDGRWKIKGFRRSEYENVIDGQVFISGIALIFTREFNHFKELWETKFSEGNNEIPDEEGTDKLPDSTVENNTEANSPKEEQDHE